MSPKFHEMEIAMAGEVLRYIPEKEWKQGPGGKKEVPQEEVVKVLRWYHDELGHLGKDRMEKLIRREMWWETMKVDIKKWNESCHHCQMFFGSPDPRMGGEVAVDPPDPNRFEWFVDFVTIRPGVIVLAFTESLSGYVEAFVVEDETADTFVECASLVFACWPWPDRLVSDNGGAFASYQSVGLLGEKGVKFVTISPHNPPANGKAERTNREILRWMKDCQSKEDVKKMLAKCLEALRSLPSTVTELPPREVMFSTMGSELVQRAFDKRLGKATYLRKRAKELGRKRPYQEVVPGDWVVLFRSAGVKRDTRKTDPRWMGPVCVEKVFDHTLHIRVNRGSISFSRKLVKKYVQRVGEGAVNWTDGRLEVPKEVSDLAAKGSLQVERDWQRGVLEQGRNLGVGLKKIVLPRTVINQQQQQVKAAGYQNWSRQTAWLGQVHPQQYPVRNRQQQQSLVRNQQQQQSPVRDQQQQSPVRDQQQQSQVRDQQQRQQSQLHEQQIDTFGGHISRKSALSTLKRSNQLQQLQRDPLSASSWAEVAGKSRVRTGPLDRGSGEWSVVTGRKGGRDLKL